MEEVVVMVMMSCRVRSLWKSSALLHLVLVLVLLPLRATALPPLVLFVVSRTAAATGFVFRRGRVAT